jgi:hypothetical protein
VGSVRERSECGFDLAVRRPIVEQAAVYFPRLLAVAEKVDPDELIGAAEVQAILRLSHPSSVTTYLKRYPDFPRPVVDLSGSRVRLWHRQDIVRWQQNERRGRDRG